MTTTNQPPLRNKVSSDWYPELPIVDGHFLIDNSSLEYYTTCRRSYEYHTLHRRVLAESRSALAFGGLIHRCLELRYAWESTTGQNPLDTAFDEIERQQVAIIEDHFRDTPVSEGDHRTAALAHEVVLLYNKYYVNEPFEILKDTTGKPLVEVPFALTLGTLEFQGRPIVVVWTGRLDAITRWTADNKVVHMDHKTSSIGGDRFFNDFLNDQGQIGYAWALQKILQMRVEGFCINALFIRRPTATGSSIEFKRRKYPLDSERIDEWQFNTLSLVSDVLRDYDRKFFPMESKWCNGKYGQCPYLDVCTVPPLGRRAMLYSGLYRDDDWSPLNKPTPTATTTEQK